MNKVINGKRYNTESAEKVGEWDNGIYGRDFNRCSETLYRKRSGEFFLHGEGGALSKYRTYAGENNWGDGEEIMPMTDAEAREWAEEKLNGDEYEKIFGAVDEAGGDVMLSFRVDGETNAKFRAAARARGISMTEMLRDMVRNIDK